MDKYSGLSGSGFECEVLEEGEIRRQITGTPQGGVISPLLAEYLSQCAGQELAEEKLS